jgi:mono/diheme cytochrome c family protein
MSEAMKHYPLMAAAAALAFIASSSAGSAADVERGKQYARRVCSVCHAVAAGQGPGVPPAPSFQSIAKSRQFRAKGAKLLWEKHGTMPNLALTGDEADDAAAYIKSLAR